MPIPSAIVTLVLGMILVLSGLWVGQNVNLLPAAASTNAPLYDELFAVLFTIGTILFLGIVGLLIFSLVRFRRRDGDLGDGVAVEGNLQLEIFWTAIPAIVVLFVGIYSYDIYDRMGGMIPLADPHAMHGSMGSAVMPASVEELVTQDVEPRLWGGIGSPGGTEAGLLPVEVTALQFAFLFHYPEGDFTSGELHVKAGQTVELRMEARDVIHAFWVPQFRLKQDVIPGQPTVLTFTPTLPGQYPIICAELCGPYHGGMRSTVVVHEPEAFDSWLASNRPATLALTAPLATG
ncbi:cytochrome c oxidase subunit II [Synechococcus sp. CS-1325]|uniref:cytochrome c oxidase subunit II n=1 Tax=Synechococcus sp. CS-1325 TaxID=2847979 RepID=UPI000DB889E2|nr:cytochrome c oxidase subunit II [Synechococcus sp. CS-1325]MCT0198792.1 cytochrome c oxidase subunit II [Synechococcus sp. CS-1325]PZV00521.1 MAG: cytochrome C oxidase subunit II [Cyanobium sp.]